MTGDGDSAHARDFIDHFLRGQVNVGEIEALRHLVVNAEDQDMAIVGLDFGGLQHELPNLSSSAR